MITVLYTCKKCALKTERAFVRDRLVTESFEGWLNNAVYRAIEISHGFYRPQCKSVMFDFYLPDEVRAPRSLTESVAVPSTVSTLPLAATNRLLSSTG